MTAARRCVVFGGSGTLGRVVCAALAQRGARVGLTYLTGEAVARELTARLDGAVARRLDLTDTAAIAPTLDELHQALGGIDAFVHCAAVGSASPEGRFDALADIDEAHYDRLLAVNVKSAVFACRHLVPLLTARGGGNIVLVGSIDGVKTLPAPVPYAVSKAALRGLAQALAKEVGKFNVRVNVVAPGVLKSGASRTLPDELKREYLKHCAAKRLGRHQEAAEVIAWFALTNTYATAQTIVVDGGL